jgi:hypothetical protein
MKYNKISNIKYFIYLIIFIIILYLLYIFYKKKNKELFNNYYNLENDNINYYRCPEKQLGQITKMVFDKNNINNNNEDWDIYIPCGYNNIENELLDIKLKNNNNNNKNKYIFGINGCDSIVAKNHIWQSLVKCYGRAGASQLMPESYILYDDDDLKLFKKDYNPNNIYILKKNVQRKEGLKLTQSYKDVINGLNDDYKVAQKYVRDLYLVNGRKVNLRIYLLIVIKNNKIHFYVSHIGKCIYTNKKYNDKDLDFESNITSYHLDISIYETNPRYFEDLIKYIDNNSVKGNGAKLFNRINTLIKNVSKCLSKNLYQSANIKNSVSFQLFGIDVIFNNDLQPYLLEMNKGPDMTPKDDEDTKMKYTVQNDMFKTVGIISNNFGENNSFSEIYSV